MRPERRDGPRRGFGEPRVPRGTMVEVRDNRVEIAMKKLKKILIREGVFNEMREREAFVKPSEKRRRSKAAARKRQAKAKAAREMDPVIWKPRPAGRESEQCKSRAGGTVPREFSARRKLT